MQKQTDAMLRSHLLLLHPSVYPVIIHYFVGTLSKSEHLLPNICAQCSLFVHTRKRKQMTFVWYNDCSVLELLQIPC